MALFRWYALQLLFAPGVVVHELAHYLTCKLLGVPVFEVDLFSFGTRAGYVEHAVPRSYTKRLLVALAPLVVNLGVGVAAFWAGTQLTGWYTALALYLGFVVIAHSLPSSVDAKTLFPRRTLGYLYPLFLLSLPLIVVLLVANRLRPYGFRFLYTLAIAGMLFLGFYTEVLQFAELQSVVAEWLSSVAGVH